MPQASCYGPLPAHTRAYNRLEKTHVTKVKRDEFDYGVKAALYDWDHV